MAINEDLYAALSAYPQTTLPERLFAYLGAQGYTGAMGDRLAQGGGWTAVVGEVLGIGGNANPVAPTWVAA